MENEKDLKDMFKKYAPRHVNKICKSCETGMLTLHPNDVHICWRCGKEMIID